jgi:uncharacterized protein YndB with AHSA1/START domain
MARRLIASLAVSALWAAPAQPKVVSAAPDGFDVAAEVTIAAPPARVWATLVAPARWWNPAHSWSGKSENLFLEPQARGCLCERWAGGSAEHLRVVRAEPGRLLRMAGALGPLQGEGVTGAMTITLSEEGGGTKVALRYAVGGRFPGGLDRVAGAVDGVLAEQLGRLKAAAEKR